MKKLTAALACAVLTLALSSAASADNTIFGVADDTGKYADNPATFFDSMRDVGLTENRMTVLWDPANPTSIVETGFLARSLPVAQAKGVAIVFAVYPLRARLLADPANMNSFLAFLELVARSYPQVTQFQVGNEPNVNFFSPAPCDAAPETYVNLLAAAYDRLKAVNGNITVISDLSPRGNDNCAASSNPSHSPVAFINRMGKAYKALSRSKPIFDRFGFHPYPNLNSDTLDKGYQWPNAGFTNLDRIKQAIWDAFNGTSQPTVEQGLQLKLAEVGWQVGVLPQLASLYTGAETGPVTTEDAQAQIYADIVRRALCDAAIHEVLFFGLIDEKDLNRFQAAFMRADGSKRASYDAVKAAIAAAGGRCAGAPVSWSHRTDVAGARGVFNDTKAKKATQLYWAHNIYAEEDASYQAVVEKATNASGAGAKATSLSVSGQVNAYFTPLVKYPGQKLAPGLYRYRITLTALMNPARTATFTSEVFQVGTKAKPKPKPKPKPKKKTKKK